MGSDMMDFEKEAGDLDPDEKAKQKAKADKVDKMKKAAVEYKALLVKKAELEKKKKEQEEKKKKAEQLSP